MSRWYFERDGKAEGPMEDAAFRESLKSGQITAQTLMLREGDDSWKTLKDYPELHTASPVGAPSASSEAPTWVILKKNGEDSFLQTGPFTFQNVIEGIGNGTIQYGQFIWKPGLEGWKRIGDLPEFDRREIERLANPVNVSVPVPKPPEPPPLVSQNDLLQNVDLLRRDQPVPEPAPSESTGTDLIASPAITAASLAQLEAIRKLKENESQASASIDLSEADTDVKDNPISDKTAISIANEVNAAMKSVAKAPAIATPVLTAPVVAEPVAVVAPSQAATGPSPVMASVASPSAPEESTATTPNIPTLRNAPAQKVPTATQKLMSEKSSEKVQTSSSPSIKLAGISSGVSERKRNKYFPRSKLAGALFAGVCAGCAVVFFLQQFRQAASDKAASEETSTAKPPAVANNPKDPKDGKPFSAVSEAVKQANDHTKKLEAAIDDPAGSKAVSAAGDSPEVKVKGFNTAKVVANANADAANQEKLLNEILGESVPGPAKQQVAQNPALSKNGLPLKAATAQAQGSNAVSQQQGAAQPVTQTHSALEIIPLKLDTPQGSLAFQTDAGVGEKINVRIHGRCGQILRWLSFNAFYQVGRAPGEIATLSIGRLGLPAGQYEIDASIGSLRTTKYVFVGVNDQNFQNELAKQIKRVANEQQTERKALFYGSRRFESLAYDLGDRFKKYKGQPALWRKYLALWRKQIKASDAPLAVYTGKAPASLAYPDDIAAFQAAIAKLNGRAQQMDAAIGQKRGIANIVPDNLGQEFSRIKLLAAKLALNQ